MVTQRCPRCASGRVRLGYRPTPIWSKVLFRYNLLCDNCNWEFTGFGLPGTVSTKPTKKPKKSSSGTTRASGTSGPRNEAGQAREGAEEGVETFRGDGENGAQAQKKRVKIKL